MKRALLNQMLYDWKSNVWFVLELAIVAFCIWVISVFLWFICRGLFTPRGFTPENVYCIEVKSINSDSPYFLEEYKDNYYDDRNELIRRLRRNPNVEYVSLHNNFSPYDYSYQGNILHIEGYPDSIVYSGNTRLAEPDIIKLMDVRSLTGKSQDELTAMLQRGEILISQPETGNDNTVSAYDFIGKIAYNYDWRAEGWKIGDVVIGVRRNDYESELSGTIIMPLQSLDSWGDIVLKVKEGKGKDFEKAFATDRSLTHLRNVYLSNLKSLVDRGEAVHGQIQKQVRILIGISFFLLITIALGLLGTFWFRVQQRVSEMAIRKTFGATSFNLFRRIIGEGMILLAGGTLLASLGVWPLIKNITEKTGQDWIVFLISQLVSVAVIALIIFFSLWYPSWRAMKIEPAIAIKDE